MKILILVIISYYLVIPNTLAQVNGNAFLNGQKDHSNIKVKFIPNSVTAKLDSTFTNSSGAYSKTISGGLYKVKFTKSGFQDYYYNTGQSFALASNSKLDDVTLLAGNVKYINGSTFGTWSKDTIYIINDNTSVSAGTSLVINSGTTIKFNGNYSLNIYGNFYANGDSTNRITFTSNMSTKTPGDWETIALFSDSCYLNYVLVEYANNGFNFSHSNPVISNSEVRYIHTKGLYCTYCSPTISGCSFHDVYGTDYSDGIGVEYSNNNSYPVIQCNKIYNCQKYGIETISNPLIYNNEIYNIGFAGVLTSFESTALIQNNFIHDSNNGIEIADNSYSPNPKIINNTFADLSSSGILYDEFYGRGVIKNNIFYNCNIAVKQWQNLIDKTKIITNNIFWKNLGGNFSGVSITGIGTFVTTNKNGDQIDSYFNLFQDPKFKDDLAPYLINNSPVFNAGDSLYSQNIGYDYSKFCYNLLLSSLEFPKDKKNTTFTLDIYPNPFVDFIFLEIIDPSEIIFEYQIFDLLGCLKISKRNVALESSKLKIENLNLTCGVYILEVRGLSGKISRKTIVKN